MRITEKDIQKKGFSVLHGKWGGLNLVQTLVGLNGIQKKSKYNIGYFAYPGFGIENIIPDNLFFGYKDLIKQKKPPVIDCNFETIGHLEQSVTRKEYTNKINYIKKLLADGEIYQMCYSIRFRKKFEGDSYSLFLKLIDENPVDFAAYLNCGDSQIISSSPERFFLVKNNKIITTPIKGTTSKENSKNLKKLLDSEKERAELDMITDLERNDIGKICEYGTVKVKKEREVLELANLWHCYSEVEGQLNSKISQNEIVEAMFPGGSITGCPKKRAMQYISSLEKLPRNIFTGSIGYTTESIMDFNIAIRTILIKDGYFEFWVGSGIVADSDSDKEYDECMLKAEKILKLL